MVSDSHVNGVLTVMPDSLAFELVVARMDTLSLTDHNVDLTDEKQRGDICDDTAHARKRSNLSALVSVLTEFGLAHASWYDS